MRLLLIRLYKYLTALFKPTKNVDQHATQWLCALQSDDLSSAQKQRFLVWLNKSAAHQQAYIRAEKVWEQADALAAVQHKITGKQRSFLLPRLHFTPQYIGMAVSASCVVVAFSFFLTSKTNDDVDSHITATYATSIGEQVAVTLPDDSILTLNTDSEVHVSFNRVERVVYLDKGEALFDVRSDKQRPFDVVTRSGIVRVKGTVFSVFDDGANTLVTVVEGQVGLDKKNLAENTFGQQRDTSFFADITLSANEQLPIELAEDVNDPQSVSAKSLISWTNKKLIYNEHDLETVLSDINRYYDIKFIMGDHAIARRKVVGVIVTDDFEKTLSALEEALHLNGVIDTAKKQVVLYAN